MLTPTPARHLAVAALSVPLGLLVMGAGGTVSAAAAPPAVVIEHYAFGPPQLTVDVGATVTWTNNDTAGHDVTSVGSGPLKSALLAKGQSYSTTFTAAGTYRYTCTVHPDMLATVTVKAAATTTTSPSGPTTTRAATSRSAPAAASSAPTTLATTTVPPPTPSSASIAAAGRIGVNGVALSSDSGGTRINPLLFIAAVVVAVVVGATISVVAPARRRNPGT